MNLRTVVGIALWVFTVAALMFGWAILLTTGRVTDIDGGQEVFVTLVGLSAPALCSALLRRHPNEWTGPLLGISVLAAVLAASRTAPLGVLSPVFGLLALVTALLPAVIALNHPALQGPRVGIATVGTGLVMWCWWITAALGVVVGLLGLWGPTVPSQWWRSEQPGAASPALTVLWVVQVLIVVVGTCTTIVVAATRYLSMPRGGRPALRPLVVPLVAWAATMAVSSGWTLIYGISDPTANIDVDPSAVVYGVLPGLLVAVLAAGIAWIDIMVRRPAVSFRGAPTGGDHQGGRDTYVEHYLSRALADPSVQVLYPIQPTPNTWVEDWVDSRGRFVQADLTSPDRAVTLIRRGSILIGLIEQDSAVTARPDAVELVATGAGLIMETEGLMAAARSDLEQSRQLASRLLSASDQPRAELRAQLLAGPLNELAEARTELAAGTPLAEIVPRLNGIAAQVRTISHGLFPGTLTRDGLAAVLPGMRVPHRRYPAAVEMTAYLTTHLDSSAAITETKVDGEAAVRIVTNLPPSDTVRDRVDALGGFVEPVASQWSITLPIGG